MRRLVPAVALAALIAGCSGTADAGTAQTARDFAAYDACTGAVSDQLKSPSSADFQSRLDVQYKTTGGDNIIVLGYVDAENSFGASLRTDWSCTTSVDSDGTVTDVTAEIDAG